MKPDLQGAPLSLLIQAYPDESADALYTLLAALFDPRANDIEWGPLYRIGPEYLLNDRTFRHVQTYAGSLAARMMISISKGILQRAILVARGGYEHDGYELIEPGGSETHISPELLIRK